LRALGRHEPPPVVTVGGEQYGLIEVFKHDSWAATALYQGGRGRMVVKFHRRHSLFLLPATWLGRWFARREARAYRMLRGVAGIARDGGEVRINGRRWSCAVAHPYLEGHPLHIDERPGDAFFSRLGEMMAAMHRRDLAYADLNKRENLIVADDGNPALVDFQLYFAPPRWTLRLPPVRWLLRELQAGDLYHLLKHTLWHRPDLVPPDERDLRRLRPRGVRIWRIIYTNPVILLRRRLLIWLRVRTGQGHAVTELAPEKAARLTLERKAADPTARLPGIDPRSP
jgi:hypothetical protein